MSRLGTLSRSQGVVTDTGISTSGAAAVLQPAHRLLHERKLKTVLPRDVGRAYRNP